MGCHSPHLPSPPQSIETLYLFCAIHPQEPKLHLHFLIPGWVGTLQLFQIPWPTVILHTTSSGIPELPSGDCGRSSSRRRSGNTGGVSHLIYIIRFVVGGLLRQLVPSAGKTNFIIPLLIHKTTPPLLLPLIIPTRIPCVWLELWGAYIIRPHV